jgi:hypothetical protein
MDGSIATEEGWQAERVDNQPLGRKHNVAMAACRGVDAAVVVGSDNWLCDRFFGVMERALLEAPGRVPPDMLGILDVHAICSYNQLCVHFGGYAEQRKGNSLGVGRVLTARVLDELSWRPWDDHVRSGLDGSMQRKLLRAFVPEALRSVHKSCADWGVTVLGIKSHVNITPFEALLRQRTSTLVDRDSVLKAYPQNEVRDLFDSFDAERRHPQADAMEARKNARLPDGTCKHLAGKGLCGVCKGRRNGCTHMSGEGICRRCLVRREGLT